MSTHDPTDDVLTDTSGPDATTSPPTDGPTPGSSTADPETRSNPSPTRRGDVIDLRDAPTRDRVLQSVEPGFTLVGRATLFVVLVNAVPSPAATAIAALATLVLFLEPERMRRAWPWLALAGALAAEQALRWWEPENHVLATTGWVLAIGLSRLAHDPARTLRLAARLLVAVIFVFATGWKLASTQYTSGDFFTYTIATDHRFAPLAEAVGGADEAALDDVRRQLRELEPGDSVVLHEGPRQRGLTVGASVFGVLAEAAVAAVFVFDGRRARRARPAVLGLFCAVTYAVVPVVGFGALVLTMGAATFDDPARRRTIVAVGVLAAWGLLVGLLLA